MVNLTTMKPLVTICFALITLSMTVSSFRLEDLGIDYLTKNCQINKNESIRVEDGFVAYNRDSYVCDVIWPTEFHAVTCDEQCCDPVIKKKSKGSTKKKNLVKERKKYSTKKYIPEPIEMSLQLQGRNGKNFIIKLPISCRCVKNKKTIRNKRKKKNSRKTDGREKRE